MTMYFKHFLGMLCAAALMLPVAGCGDSDGEGTPAEKELELVVSENKVRIGTEVSFTVLDGGTDVTAAARIRNVKTETYVESAFVPEETGVYRFEAELDGRVSKPVSLTAVGSFEPQGEFYRQVLVQKFTATWCQYCPLMTSGLENLDQEVPDRMIVMAVHCNDAFSIIECQKLADDFRIVSLPSAVFDCRVVTTYMAAQLKEALEGELDDYPAVCGIAAESEAGLERINVEAKIRFSEKGRYRVCCAVVEDGLQYMDGYSEDGYYNQVLRAFATSRTGVTLGECEAGTEYPCEYAFTADRKWNLANCRVLIYVMKEEGAAVYTNNVVSLPVQNGSCDYRYEAE